MKRSIYLWLGIVVWATVLVAASAGLSKHSGLSLTQFGQTTSCALLDHASAVVVRDESLRLRVGDPIFVQIEADRWTQVGSVRQIDPETGWTTIAWYGDRPALQFEITSHFQTGRLDEVIATMLPSQQRDRISAKVSLLMKQHGDEMARAMLPLVKESLRDSIPVIQKSMEESVARHRDEIDALAERWNDEVVRQQLVPLARDEMLPIVRRHAQPVVEKMGRELWDRASLWRFGWRAVYDKSPLPKQDLVQEEWDRFVQQEALPVLEDHTDELVNAVQQTMQSIAKNPRVRSELSSVATELASDQESKRLLGKILRETLIDNDSLRDVWRSVWTSPEAKEVLERIGDRVEPVVRQIGDELFGTPETGIHPNFARVLRNQILGKDRRFATARLRQSESQPGSPIVIKRASESIPYPVVYLANPETVGSL
jgi:hypothetical protein